MYSFIHLFITHLSDISVKYSHLPLVLPPIKFLVFDRGGGCLYK